MHTRALESREQLGMQGRPWEKIGARQWNHSQGGFKGGA